MTEYHKIQSIYKRDPATKKFIIGQWSTPEIEYLCDKTWVWDEKIDGMNIRVEWDGKQRTLKGRTDRASIPSTLYERLEQLFPTESLRLFWGETPACLYGEGFGVKIQKGGAYLPDRVDFILFDVRVGKWWLRRDDVEDISANFKCLDTPIVGEGTLLDAIAHTCGGFPSHFGTAQAEGLVLRPRVPLFGRSGERVITKIKTADFR